MTAQETSCIHWAIRLTIACQILFPFVIAAPMIAPALKPLGFEVMGHEIFPRYGFDTWPYFEFPTLLVAGEMLLFVILVFLRGVKAILTNDVPPKTWQWRLIIIIIWVWIISSLAPILLGIKWIADDSELARQAIWMILGSLGIATSGGIFLCLFKSLSNHLYGEGGINENPGVWD